MSLTLERKCPLFREPCLRNGCLAYLAGYKEEGQVKHNPVCQAFKIIAPWPKETPE